MGISKYRNRKCIDELFTVEEFKLANEIRLTYDCGYCPVALKDTTQIKGWCSCGIEKTRHMTLRFYYATQVWQEALLVFAKEDIYDSCFGKPCWKDEGCGFRFVEFEQTNGTSLAARIARFWGLLKEVANSKKIFVYEQVIRESETLEDDFCDRNEQIKVTYILDKDDLSCWAGYSPDLSGYNYSSVRKSYSWDEIKDFFVEISPRILSLVHYNKMNVYNPNDSATKALHKACEQLNISAVKQALANGADPNGFDEGGDTPLVACVDDFYRYNKDDYKLKPPEEIKRDVDLRILIMKELLDNGADIDFYGVDCFNAITETCYPQAYEIMEFLLENGANPNHNCSIIDEPYSWYIQSSILSMVNTDISFEEMEGNSVDNLLIMQKLLMKYGAKFYIDDFDPDEYFKD